MSDCSLQGHGMATAYPALARALLSSNPSSARIYRISTRALQHGKAQHGTHRLFTIWCGHARLDVLEQLLFQAFTLRGDLSHAQMPGVQGEGAFCRSCRIGIDRNALGQVQAQTVLACTL